ncbi:MAG: rod shape-determining protein RodA [Sedimentisphaerales bacterium]|nr:rod shape-determining protein RodA [Sedimentisphaerales bacterium]
MHNFIKGRLLLVRVCLLACTFLLVATGVATLYAVGHPAETSVGMDPAELAELAGYWKKQLMFAVIGLGGFVAANLVNYRKLGEVSYAMYGVILVMLALLLVSRFVGGLPFMEPSHGAFRWIQVDIAGHQLPSIQPSELCKIAYILALAWYLRYRSNYRSFKALLGPFALTLLPMALILLEPDLGTVMLMLPVLFSMLFIAGARAKHLLFIILLAVLVSPAMWLKMEPYQRRRVSSVLLQSDWIRARVMANPTLSNLVVGGKFSERLWRSDWGFHIIRSKYAVASGGLSGTGFGRGPFVKYNFLPERHNDFIFSVLAHQWGFLGCLGVLLLYALMVACSLEIGANNIDPFARLVAIGVAAMFVIEIAVNIGMTLGIMPVTGLTLPFISYGGSSLLVNMMTIGLLNNIGRCRPFTVAPKR